MNTRRKFLSQASLATTALLIADPFKNFANTVSPLTGYSINDRKIVLLHTGYNGNGHQVASHASSLKKNIPNMVVLHTGNRNEFNTTALNYDESIHTNGNDHEQYKIIYKADIKIAIIKVMEAEAGLINNINTLSAYLKKEKKCQLVVCLSQLGYKNDAAIDDRKLAEASTHLDVIIGAHPVNFCNYPMVAHNSNREEVIINSASNNCFALGNIEIGFDKKRNKNSIAINNLIAAAGN